MRKVNTRYKTGQNKKLQFKESCLNKANLANYKLKATNPYFIHADRQHVLVTLPSTSLLL